MSCSSVRRASHATVCQSTCQRAFVAAGHANQAGGKLGEIVERSDSLRTHQQLFG